MTNEHLSSAHAADQLLALIRELAEHDAEDRAHAGLEEAAAWLEGAQGRTYDAGGYLTMDEGFTLELASGERLHITVRAEA